MIPSSSTRAACGRLGLERLSSLARLLRARAARRRGQPELARPGPGRPLGEEVCVVEDAGDAWRLVRLRVRAGGALRVEEVRVEPTRGAALSAAPALFSRRARRAARPLLVVTAAALARVSYPAEEPPRSGAAAGERRLTLALSPALRSAWERAASAQGLTLLGFYPFASSALAGVRVDQDKPQLLLQVERRTTAVIECVGASLRDLAVHAHERPTLARCRELIGEACPLALLAGGGTDLSELGYGLVREGTTWVRLAPLLAEVDCDAHPASLAAVVGAARHAAGLAPEDAVACLTPRAAPGA